ncbi:hypothetical protein DIPPA_28284 [Diplonema papillatum]|nr:hypothetical protein DIPPA_28284 [Diplonema papillatum]|eukprot:gene804-1240_t
MPPSGHVDDGPGSPVKKKGLFSRAKSSLRNKPPNHQQQQQQEGSSPYADDPLDLTALQGQQVNVSFSRPATGQANLNSIVQKQAFERHAARRDSLSDKNYGPPPSDRRRQRNDSHSESMLAPSSVNSLNNSYSEDPMNSTGDYKPDESDGTADDIEDNDVQAQGKDAKSAVKTAFQSVFGRKKKPKDKSKPEKPLDDPPAEPSPPPLQKAPPASNSPTNSNTSGPGPADAEPPAEMSDQAAWEAKKKKRKSLLEWLPASPFSPASPSSTASSSFAKKAAQDADQPFSPPSHLQPLPQQHDEPPADQQHPPHQHDERQPPQQPEAPRQQTGGQAKAGEPPASQAKTKLSHKDKELRKYGDRLGEIMAKKAGSTVLQCEFENAEFDGLLKLCDGKVTAVKQKDLTDDDDPYLADVYDCSDVSDPGARRKTLQREAGKKQADAASNSSATSSPQGLSSSSSASRRAEVSVSSVVVSTAKKTVSHGVVTSERNAAAAASKSRPTRPQPQPQLQQKQQQQQPQLQQQQQQQQQPRPPALPFSDLIHQFGAGKAAGPPLADARKRYSCGADAGARPSGARPRVQSLLNPPPPPVLPFADLIQQVGFVDEI